MKMDDILNEVMCELTDEDIQLLDQLETTLAGGSCGLGCTGTK